MFAILCKAISSLVSKRKIRSVTKVLQIKMKLKKYSKSNVKNERNHNIFLLGLVTKRIENPTRTKSIRIEKILGHSGRPCFFFTSTYSPSINKY